MPTLKTFAGEPRPKRNCGCATQPCGCTTKGSCSTTPPSALTPPLVPGVEPCGPGPGETQLPGNQPVEDDLYQCSVAVRLQPAIDRVRRITHVLGYRPYRVFMVWQTRERDRAWRTFREMELIPVRLVSMLPVDLDLSQVGLQAEGAIQLREVSPSQVTEDELRGFLDGALWGSDTIDRQFFYEVRLHERCTPADVPGRFPVGGPKRRRFILGAEPDFRGDSNEWRVGLVDQEIARTRDGRDSSIDPDRPLPPALPRLVP